MKLVRSNSHTSPKGKTNGLNLSPLTQGVVDKTEKWYEKSGV